MVWWYNEESKWSVELADQEENPMRPFDKCPVCGGELIEKEVEKLLRGGNDTASITVRAEVCLGCGERLYAEETVQRFEEVRKKLEQRETESFQEIGQTFLVA
jgi:YgiT-type zinc finger domain-containing protein